MATDKNIKIVKLQKEIQDYIGLGENSIVFNFEENKKQCVLHVITVNPRHNQSFLFHDAEGRDKIECLELVLEYVKHYKNKESSYTIQWSVKGENVLQTSYFSAKNVLSALDKLYYDRDPNSITIFNISLNPIT